MPDNKLLVSHNITLDGLQTYNPRSLMEQLVSLGRPVDHFWGKVNSYVMPRGKHPGVGYVLMSQKDLKLIESQGNYNQFYHSLSFYDDYNGGLVINNLAISRSRALTGLNLKQVSSVLYLVELSDSRSIAHYSAVDKVYNVRTYQYLTLSNNPDYYTHSLNGGTPWTWQKMVEDLWGYLPGIMGVPKFEAFWPYTGPENFQFRGMNAWDAICTILDYTGHTVYPDLNGNYTIGPKGKSQNLTTFEQTLRQNGYCRDLSWDFPDQKYSLSIPSKVTVYFHTAYHAFQNVATDTNSRIVTGKDAWLFKPVESREYTSSNFVPGLSAVAETNVALHDSLCAYYDESGILLNGSELDIRSEEVAKGYLASKLYKDNASLHSVYLGYHKTILPGTEVSAVQWFEIGSGSRTEILLSPLHYSPKDELMGLGQHYVNSMLAWETEGPPDVARHHEPTDRMALVRVYGGDINPEGVGEGYVLYGSHTGGNPISWADSTKLIAIHNPWKVKIPEDTRLMVFWHLQTRRWVCAFPRAAISLFSGELQADMCPDQSGVPKNYRLRDVTICKNVEPVYEVKNSLKLAARNNDKFIAFWNCDLNSGAGGYDILQVEHHVEEYVRADFEDVAGCTPELDEYGYPTGKTVPTFQCKVKYSKREINVQWCKDPVENLTLVNAELRNVMSDWWVDGKYIKGKFEPVYVMCACDPYEEILHIGTDCTEGSGSGSGSGPAESPICCDLPVNAALNIEFYDKTGDCDCLPTMVRQLLFQPNDLPPGFIKYNVWSLDYSECGGCGIDLVCSQLQGQSEPVWACGKASCGVGTLVSQSCDPFELIFSFDQSMGGATNCSGTYKVRITY